MNLTVAQIAEIIKAEFKGDANFIPCAPCGLDFPKEGGIGYVSDIKKIDFESIKTGALIVPASAKNDEIPFKGVLFYAENPEWAFTQILRIADTLNKDIVAQIHAKAYVSDKAFIGKNVHIGANATVEDGAFIGDDTIIYPNVYVGRNVKIGAFCVLYPNVTVREDCVLKNKVILQPGCVIGSDGFGYIFYNGKHEKIPQIGNVIIEDDVEIGANTTIDRAKINSTVIGANTKIDNLVQVGHNVKIGRASIIVSQAGIAGSAIIGNGVIIAGQAGLSGHLKIGDRATIGPQAGIMSDVEAGAKVIGSPSMNYGEFMRSYAVLKKLPELYKEFMSLKKKFKFFG
ncbi:MAG: UDP-3-O-(3-hydroxymyristoyl)glucosamine N-acyltransferase [Elusimicrobiota bacterium]|jgi:UDP-3-O-[3-hydroxymyristoyl] glucosamine N-acyltransferase|nr:UDP-3-O-(3-hydroxymyristoyl)glucosamine N-acyltransferase [Elusimicrobiota bacterium]